MDRAKEEAYAKTFDKDGDCYVKGEMRDGVLELVVSGHQLAILHVAGCMIDRVCEVTGRPFSEALEAITIMHDEIADDNIIPFRGKH